MSLAVVEADRLHAREAFQCPNEANRRILPAGEQDQRAHGSRCGRIHRAAQSQPGTQDASTRRPFGCASAAISFISAGVSSKSKMAKFSASRCGLDVRGMT